jgi:hypothetical protein
MHYHLVLTDERGCCVAVRSVDGHSAADREARLVLASAPDWTPTRYPGRSWRRGEVTVFVDRRRALRRELSVLRCGADHATAPLDCPLRSLGIPALNLQPIPAVAPAPAAADDRIRAR